MSSRGISMETKISSTSGILPTKEEEEEQEAIFKECTQLCGQFGYFNPPTKERVQQLVAAFPGVVNQRDSQGDYLLYNACMYGACSLEILQLLLPTTAETLPLIHKQRILCASCFSFKRLHWDVVLWLANLWPEATNSTWRPLHYLLRRLNEDDVVTPVVIQKLASAAPSSPSPDDIDHQIPHPIFTVLHDARSWEIIQIILREMTGAIYARDTTSGDYETPLHTAIRVAHHRSTPTFHQIEYLISLLPQSVLVQTKLTGQCPLHYATKMKPNNSKIVQILLDAAGKSGRCAAAVRDKDGNLPIHLASKVYCGSTTDLASIQNLVEAYPEGIYERCGTPLVEGGGRSLLPVELAYRTSKSICSCLCPKNRSLLNFLISQPGSVVLADIMEQYPDLIEEETGNTTLHCACQLSFLFVVHKLIAKIPHATRIPNRFGELPLHIICHASSSTHLSPNKESAISAVLEPFEEAAKVPITSTTNNHMRLVEEWPLHLLLRNNPTASDPLMKILKLYPDAIGKVDMNGELPVVIVAQNAPLDVLFCMLQLRPDVLLVPLLLSVQKSEGGGSEMEEEDPAAANLVDNDAKLVDNDANNNNQFLLDGRPPVAKRHKAA